MPLEKRLINVPLSAGLSQKTDVRGLAPMQAATMSNCVHLKNGAIRKRAGMALVAPGVANGHWGRAPVTLAVSGGSYRGSSWVSDRTTIYNYSEQENQLYSYSPLPEAVALDRIQAVSDSQAIVDFDWCLVSGAVAWIVFNIADPYTGTIGSNLTVLDVSAYGQTSGLGGVQQGMQSTVLQNGFVPYSSGRIGGIAPKLITCGTNVVFTWIDASGNLQAALYPASSALTADPVPSVQLKLVDHTAMSAGAIAGAYDIAPIVGDTTRFLLAYTSNTPAAVLVTVTVSTLVVGTARAPIGATSINATSVACYGTNGGYLWAVYGAIVTSKRNLYAGFYNEGGATLSTTSTAFFTDATTAIPIGKMGLCQGNTDANGDVVECVWSTGYASGTTAMQSATTQYLAITGSGTTATAGTLQGPIPGVQLASRPAWDTDVSSAYVAVATPSTLQGTPYLVRLVAAGSTLTPALPVACFAPRLQKKIAQPMVTSGSFSLPHMLAMPNVPSLANQVGAGLGVMAVPLLYSTSTFHTAIALQPVDMFCTVGRANAELGSIMAISGGLPVSWDGQNAAELGFCAYPEPTATDVTGGGSLSAGTYQYIVTFEWYDGAGNVHRSATSPVQTITAALNDKATVVIPNTIGLRNPSGASGAATQTSPVYGIVWRTTAGGSTFYRQTADPPPTANAFQPTTQTITITDTMSDATLTAASTAQVLYTTGGNLDNFNPPSARCCVQHTSRWFLAGCDNPLAIWPSKALTDGEVPGFNEQMAFFAHGAVRALASMDDKLVIFYQRGAQYGIEYVTGQGPLDTGAQSDWSPPLPVPTNVGAIDQRGTCVGDFGILFRSPVGGPNGTGGIFLLARDLQVSYVSGPVEDAIAASPVVTSMVVHPNNGRVYITLITNDAAPATAGNVTRLVWDYVNGGVWSTDNVYDSSAAGPGLPVRCAWVAPTTAFTGAAQANTYWCAKVDGSLYRENDTGSGSTAYHDRAGDRWITMSYTSAPLQPDLDGFARFWRVQLQADSLETHDFTMQLLYDGAPAAYYQESHTWTSTQAATFDRFPQVDVEMLCGNQKAKRVQVVLTDATPTGGGATTGQGPSWSTISVELGVKAGRYPNLPPGQRS